MSRSTCRANSEADDASDASDAETKGDNAIQSIAKMRAFFIVVTSYRGARPLNSAHKSSLFTTASTVTGTECFAKSSRKHRLLAKRRWGGGRSGDVPAWHGRQKSISRSGGLVSSEHRCLRPCSMTVRSIEIRDGDDRRHVFRRPILCNDLKVAEIKFFFLQHQLGNRQVATTDGSSH